MIYLDTHVIVWLYAGLVESFTQPVRELMNALDILEFGHRTLRNTLDGVPMQHWETPGVCGYWSIKEIAAYLASYEQWHVDIVHNLLDDGAATPILDLMLSSDKEFNAVEVPRRSVKTAEEVLADYESFHDQLMESVSELPADERARAGETTCRRRAVGPLSQHRVVNPRRPEVG